MITRMTREEPAWLSDREKAAWEAYQDLPLPDRVDRVWRFTDPKLFIPKGDVFQLSPGPSEHHVAPWCEVCKGEFRGDDQTVGISVDGWTHTVSIPDRLSTAGVRLMDLGQAIREHEEIVAPHLGRLVAGETRKLEALNLAAWHGGLFLYLPSNVRIDKPVHLFVNENGGSPFFASRILVVMGRGSSMTLFTEYTGRSNRVPDSRRQVNAVVEIVQGESTDLQHVTVQRFPQDVNGYLVSRAELGASARLLSVLTSFGGGVIKVDTGAVLTGSGAESDLVGFAFGEEKQHFDHHTMYDHRAPHTRSDLDFKVVLKGRARSIFTGLLRIAKDAPYCEAYQENRNVLLSDNARADTIPELEILTDEVRCTHGATVGPLDAEQVFYLMSRGMTREDAVRMVVGGFLEPTLQEIPGELQGKVRRCVNERLGVF